MISIVIDTRYHFLLQSVKMLDFMIEDFITELVGGFATCRRLLSMKIPLPTCYSQFIRSDLASNAPILYFVVLTQAEHRSKSRDEARRDRV